MDEIERVDGLGGMVWLEGESDKSHMFWSGWKEGREIEIRRRSEEGEMVENWWCEVLSEDKRRKQENIWIKKMH